LPREAAWVTTPGYVFRLPFLTMRRRKELRFPLYRQQSLQQPLCSHPCNCLGSSAAQPAVQEAVQSLTGVERDGTAADVNILILIEI